MVEPKAKSRGVEPKAKSRTPIPDLAHELELKRHGHTLIAGLDEAGRGSLAGPVVAAVAVLPLERFDLARMLDGVRDSKLMPPKARQHWAAQIRQIALAAATGLASAAEVDQLGLLPATRLAMQRALSGLALTPSYLLIDHLRLPEVELPQLAITRGDQQVLSIAAASVLAKVTRDQLMRRLGERYPEYGFGQHKGYGTAMHRQALQQLGPCPAHRRSYAPVQAALAIQQ